MSASKKSLGSKLNQIDAHVIQPTEYDELPEITDADLARGTWKIGSKFITPDEGKVAFSTLVKKEKINITLDPDVLAWFRQQAGGRGYQTLINATLREAMRGQQIEAVLRKIIREELHST